MPKPKKIVVYWLLSVFICLSACNGKVHQSSSTKPVVKIGYLPITHAAPLFLGSYVNTGISNTYEVELIKFNSWPDLMDALNAGRIDGASVLIQLAMKAKEKGIDLKAVALGHQDGNVLISAKDIEGVEDLKGKTFAIPHTYSTHHLLLNELLRKEGLTNKDVNIVELPPAEMPAALAEERISGYVVAEPFGALAINLDIGKVLTFSESFWPNSYCCVLVLRGEFIDENTDVANDFMKDYVDAGSEAHKKEDNLYAALNQFMNVDKEVLELSLEWISFDYLRIEEEEYNKLRDRVIRLELMESPPQYDEFVENSLIDRTNR